MKWSGEGLRDDRFSDLVSIISALVSRFQISNGSQQNQSVIGIWLLVGTFFFVAALGSDLKSASALG